MASADNNIWFTVDFNLKELDLATGLAVKVSNRPVLGDDGADIAGGRYYPILKSFSGVGADCRGPLPKSGTGTIVLTDENNQFDNFRKFSDLLQRYTLINTTATIKMYHGPEDDNDIRADLTTIWTAKVQSVRRSTARDSFDPTQSYSTLEITLQSRGLESKVVTKEINAENFSDAPTKSLGKHLPIVFGSNRQVKAYPIDADAAFSVDYAYAATFSDDFYNADAQKYYFRDDEGVYIETESAGSTSTELNGYALDANKAQDIYTQEELERVYEITPSTTYLITQWHFYLYTSSSGPSSKGIFKIREDDGGVPGRIVRQAIFDFSTTSGTGEQKIEGTFSKPLVMDANKTWYFGFSINEVEEGSELTNGDFSSGTGWTTESGWSIGSGVASLSTTSTTNRLVYQSPPLQVGTQYRMGGTVTNLTGSGRTGISNACLDAAKADRTITANGTVDVVGIAKQEQWEWFGRASSGTFTLDLDNVYAQPLGKQVYPYTSTVDNASCWFQEKSAGTGGERVWRNNATSDQPYFALYGVAITDSAFGTTAETDRNGLAHSKLTLTQKTAPTNFTAPNIGALNIIVETDGLEDDGSGTLTSSARQRLEYIDNVVQLLQYEWNGSAWADSGEWDFSQFATTYTTIRSTTNGRYREVDGATTGRTTFEDLIRDLCVNQAARVVMLNDGKFALYCFGETRTSVKTLTDDDIRILSVNWLGTETVINSAQINYDRRIVNADITDAVSSGTLTDYASSIRWENNTNGETGALTGQNRNIYGVRELNKTDYPWIAEDGTAESLARFFFGVYRHPHIYCSLELPLALHSELELMDVVELLSPELSTYFGSQARANLPHYDDDAVDLLYGQHWRRAQRYRAQIEAKELSWNSGEYPVMRLVCRILNNHPYDPT